MILACVGRRDLRQSERLYLESVGASYAEQGCIITSGNAPGSDQAYAHGASLVDGKLVELYLPWSNFERKHVKKDNTFWTADQAWPKHLELAMQASPGWDRIRDTVKPLCIRNAMIIYRWGTPVDLVIAYPDCGKHGWSGTGHSMRIAASLNIPVWLANKNVFWNPLEGLPVE